jgi:hypothetical protein
MSRDSILKPPRYLICLKPFAYIPSLTTDHGDFYAVLVSVIGVCYSGLTRGEFLRKVRHEGEGANLYLAEKDAGI